MVWSDEFSEPISLRNGNEVRTVSDARDFIIKMRAECNAEEWHVTTELALLAANGGSAEPARNAMISALIPLCARPQRTRS